MACAPPASRASGHDRHARNNPPRPAVWVTVRSIQRALWFGLAALAPAVMACVASEPPPMTATPTVEATPTATREPTITPKLPLPTPVPPSPTVAPRWDAHPVGTRTGNAAVDRVLTAVEARDRQALLELVSISSIPCAAPGPVVPQVDLCPEGSPVGTPKTGVWYSHIEGGLRPPGFALDGFLGLSPVMFAVAEVTPTPEAIPFGGGEIEVFFWLDLKSDKIPGKLILRDGLITSVVLLDWNPNLSPRPQGFRSWILPPP